MKAVSENVVELLFSENYSAKCHEFSFTKAVS